jgi:hypothetical protein
VGFNDSLSRVYVLMGPFPTTDSKFNHDTPNVVHMTIKPQDYVDEEDTKAGKDRLGSGSEARQRSPRCRCVIM